MPPAKMRIPTCTNVQLLLSMLAISLSSLAAAADCGNDGRVVLPIGLFASTDMLRTSAAIPAAELAIQQVNDNSSILPWYCLKGVAYDTEVRWIYNCM